MGFRLIPFVLAAVVAAVCVAPVASAAPPRATALEKVSSTVQPGIVYVTTRWRGLVAGRFPGEVVSRCSGFFVSPEGHFVTAGHCVDRGEGRKAVIQDALAGAPPDLIEDALRFARIRSVEEPSRIGPDREVQAAYGVQYGGLPTGKPLPARVLGVRAPNKGDVGLAKLEVENVPALTLAPEAEIGVGTKVVSVGYPATVDLVTDQTFDPSFKEGSISSKKTREGGLFEVYEISAAVSGGMSGGPTVDLDGRVVGVNSFGIVGEPQAFNFVSPVAEVAELLADKGVENRSGPVTTSYREGLRAYYAGDREEALAKFDEVLGQVQEHEFAQEFRAKALRLPEEEDGGFPTALLVLLIALGVLGLGAGAWFLQRRRGAAAPAGTPLRGSPTALLVTSGPRRGGRFEITQESVIGRDADIALDDHEVSRRHASLKPVDGGLVLTDLESANGTFVNGSQLDRPMLLADGDIISVGGTSLTVDSPAARAVGRTRLRRSSEALPIPTLVINAGPLAGKRFPIERDLLVGRAGADITVQDPEVSRQHARVKPMNGGIEVTDLGSANGTVVNGVRIDGPTRVVHGDEIRFGQTAITLVVGDGEPRPKSTVARSAAEKTRPGS